MNLFSGFNPLAGLPASLDSSHVLAAVLRLPDAASTAVLLLLGVAVLLGALRFLRPRK